MWNTMGHRGAWHFAGSGDNMQKMASGVQEWTAIKHDVDNIRRLIAVVAIHRKATSCWTAMQRDGLPPLGKSAPAKRNINRTQSRWLVGKLKDSCREETHYGARRWNSDCAPVERIRLLCFVTKQRKTSRMITNEGIR